MTLRHSRADHPAAGYPADLRFVLEEQLAGITAVLVSKLVSLDGCSEKLVGSLLLADDRILAAPLYFQPL